MGGGMNKRGDGLPMHERVARSRAATSSPAADDCPSRHCWVSDASDGVGVKRPGLLVEWRQTHLGWEGRVVYAARVRPHGWALVEEWVPADLLTEA